MGRPLFLVVRKRLVVFGLLLVLGGLFVVQFTGWPAIPAATRMSETVAGKRIVIDPGHGGVDPGAVGFNGTLEKTIVLPISLRLRQLLHEAAVYTVLTRSGDVDLGNSHETHLFHRKVQDLKQRVSMAGGSDVYVSIHANSFPSSRWSGAQTFYYPGKPEGKRLAEAIQHQLVTRLGPNNRKARPGEYRVLRDTKVPAVVVEVGFLSNPQEEELLNSPQYQQRVAEALFQGIVQYFAQRPAQQARVLTEETPQLVTARPFDEPALTDIGRDGYWLFFLGTRGPQEDLAGFHRAVSTDRLPDSVQGRAEFVLQQLLEGPLAGEQALAVLPDGVRVESMTLDDRTARVGLTAADITAPQGFAGERLMYQALANTLSQFAEIDGVEVYLQEDSAAVFGEHLGFDPVLHYDPATVGSWEGSVADESK